MVGVLRFAPWEQAAQLRSVGLKALVAAYARHAPGVAVVPLEGA